MFEVEQLSSVSNVNLHAISDNIITSKNLVNIIRVVIYVKELFIPVTVGDESECSRLMTPGQQWITPEDKLCTKWRCSHESDQTHQGSKGAILTLP